jgi:pantoate kinase
MPIRIRQLATVLAAALAAGGLSGCGTINEKLAAGLGDVIPQWAGGLPADAPPRPGTAKYDEFMQERERKRLETASPKTEGSQPSSREPDAVH